MPGRARNDQSDILRITILEISSVSNMIASSLLDQGIYVMDYEQSNSA